MNHAVRVQLLSPLNISEDAVDVVLDTTSDVPLKTVTPLIE